MDLSVGKLRQLLAAARIGSISRTAGELNLSQPALSRSIAAIERHYGFAIFNRLGHGVQVSAGGAQVLQEAESALQALQVLDSNLRLFGQGRTGRLNLGMTPLLAGEYLPRLAADFFAPREPSRLAVSIKPGAALLQEMRDNRIEQFFFPESHIELCADVEFERIGSIMPVFAVRSRHPLASRESVTAADLAAYPLASSVDPPIPVSFVSPSRFVCDSYHVLMETVLRSDMAFISSSGFVAPHVAAGRIALIDVLDLQLDETAIYRARLRGRIDSPLAKSVLTRMKAYLDEINDQ